LTMSANDSVKRGLLKYLEAFQVAA
jgi:hypothetical protein